MGGHIPLDMDATITVISLIKYVLMVSYWLDKVMDISMLILQRIYK